MTKKQITSEIKRLIKLSHQTRKIHGNRFLIREIIRYILNGPLEPDPYYTPPGEFYKFEYKLKEIQKIQQSFTYQPLISLITAIRHDNIKYLRNFLLSILEQHYANWELCICYSYNISPKLEKMMCHYKNEHRVIWINTHNQENQWEQLNAATKKAGGTYIGFPNISDLLSEYALLENVKYINKHDFPDLLYSDEDYFSKKGKYKNHHFKSDFNLPLLLSHNYISNFVLIRKQAITENKCFREGYDNAEIYDLILRTIHSSAQVIHIPRILYHTRLTDEIKNNLSHNKSNENVLNSYLEKNKIKATITNDSYPGYYRIKYELNNNGKVSIIIPFKDNVALLKKCINSVIEKTTYPNYELLLISNNSEQESTFEYLNHLTQTYRHIKVYEYNIPFNFSAINNWAVRKSSGQYILLLNDDTEIINKDWLESMIEHIQQTEVGVVGAKLLYDDNTIQHAGIVVGLSKLAGHPHRFLSNKKPGYYHRPHLVQCVTAVTGACLLTKRSIWDTVGGMDEINLAVAYNDVDYCMKVREIGYHVIYTPYATLYHHESKSRGADDTPEKQKRYIQECRNLIKKWKTDSFVDPYYNVNLTQVLEDYSIR